MAGQGKLDSLEKLRIRFENNVLLSYVNINSIRNKIAGLFSVVNTNFDILCIAETKLDSSFPKVQFALHAYKSCRLDVSGTSGGYLIVVLLNSVYLGMSKFCQ